MMQTRIASVQNPRVKQWVELQMRKGRESQDRFLIEGNRLVQEALLSKAPVETVIYEADKGFPEALRQWAKDTSLEWVEASASVLAKLADTKTPQGVCAVVHRTKLKVEAVALAAMTLAIIVDGIQDPGNLGTIIRSADAARADAVIVGTGSVDIYNAKTIRSTMGSLFHLPVVECDLTDLFALRSKLPKSELQVISASLQADEHCYGLDFRKPTWIVVGNEAGGVSPGIAEKVDLEIKIPMPGKAESLNAAVAASVLLFEAVRQRHY